MSVRIILCFLVVIGFSIYAYRNWFASLCVAIVMMAVLEHPDMPKSIGGIQGLNPWNFLMANVLLSWFRHRRNRDGLVWDMPRHVMVLSATYLFVILWGFVRLVMDLDHLKNEDIEDFGKAWVISEFLINCIKWVLPGILLYDACRTRRRMLIGLICTLSVYFLLALQVIKHMPLRSVAASGAELSRLANKILTKSVGYHRVNLSMMLSGASWAVLTTLALAKTRRNQLLLMGAAAVISLGQALTGGRAGYVTWGLLGLILCVVRWRRLIPVIPLTVIAVCTFVPGVRERMLQGFGSQTGPYTRETSTEEIMSGRNIAWSYVIPMIWQSPIIGYGRQAMIRTGTAQKLEEEEGETFPHPHNAYLEMLLDNGVVGFCMVIPFYLVVLWHAFKILLDRSDPLYAAVGGTACALILALCIAAMGSQTFYPREGSVGMWAAIGIVLRLSVERTYARSTGEELFGEESDSLIETSEDSPQAV